MMLIVIRYPRDVLLGEVTVEEVVSTITYIEGCLVTTSIRQKFVFLIEAKVGTDVFVSEPARMGGRYRLDTIVDIPTGVMR